MGIQWGRGYYDVKWDQSLNVQCLLTFLGSTLLAEKRELRRVGNKNHGFLDA